MTYQYEPTKAEQRAAARLRKKGWRVDEPACPECHGMGFVWHGEAGYVSGSIGTKPCSYGCPVAALFFPLASITSPAPIDSEPNWPLCTCPKGNYTGDWICARHNPQNSTTGVTF